MIRAQALRRPGHLFVLIDRGWIVGRLREEGREIGIFLTRHDAGKSRRRGPVP